MEKILFVTCLFALVVPWSGATDLDDASARRLAQCALQRSELLGVTHSCLADHLALKGKVGEQMESLDKLHKEHEGVLKEHLVVLDAYSSLQGDHLTLLQEKDALQGTHLTLQKDMKTLKVSHSGLQEDHHDCLETLSSNGKEHEAVKVKLHSLGEEHRGLTEDYDRLQQDHGSLRGRLHHTEEHLRSVMLEKDEMSFLLKEKDEEIAILTRELAKASQGKEEVVNYLKRVKETWEKVERERREKHESLFVDNQRLEKENYRHKQELDNLNDMYLKSVREKDDKERLYLSAMSACEDEKESIQKDSKDVVNDMRYEMMLAMAAHEKEMNAKEENYKTVKEERNTLADEVRKLKTEQNNAMKEKQEMREYYERSVYVATLTIDRIKKEMREKCAKPSQPTHKAETQPKSIEEGMVQYYLREFNMTEKQGNTVATVGSEENMPQENIVHEDTEKKEDDSNVGNQCSEAKKDEKITQTLPKIKEVTSEGKEEHREISEMLEKTVHNIENMEPSLEEYLHARKTMLEAYEGNVATPGGGEGKVTQETEAQHSEKESMKERYEMMLAMAADEKEKMVTEKEEMNKIISEERKTLADEVRKLKTEHGREKQEMREYYEGSVYLATLTIDRLKKEMREKCAKPSQPTHKAETQPKTIEERMVQYYLREFNMTDKGVATVDGQENVPQENTIREDTGKRQRDNNAEKDYMEVLQHDKTAETQHQANT